MNDKLMAMVAAAYERCEYRTGDPDPDNDDDFGERDGDDASYELQLAGECLTVVYFYCGGSAGITIALSDHVDADPATVARDVVDAARKAARNVEPW